MCSLHTLILSRLPLTVQPQFPLPPVCYLYKLSGLWSTFTQLY
uniref:Uncharacterized protein n=1 Tax=Anguilla anguilla TaxID=7936 RepID=A0A0E9QCG1_ANGAN